MTAPDVKIGARIFGRALRQPALATLASPAVVDPYLFYTATLTPVVLLVALLARRPGEIWVALGLSAVAIAAQFVFGRFTTRARRRSTAWQLVRLAVPLLYVALCVQLVGGPALPLLALFIPVVAAAAAVGRVQGLVTATMTVIVCLAPEAGNLDSPAAVVLRGVTLAGVVVVLAFGTRLIVSAHEKAVSEARAAVVAERRRSRQIDALDAVGHLLASAGPSSELLDQVLDVIVQRFGYQHVSIYLGDAQRVEVVSHRGFTETIPSFSPDAGVAGRAMRERRIAFVPDISLDPDFVPGTPGASPTTSLISAPLIVGDAFLGVLNVETTGARRLDQTDRSVVGILAGRVATAVALGRDHQALATRARLFRDIGDFSAEVASSLAIGPLTEVVVTAVARVVGAETVALTLLDRATGGYAIRAIRGGDARAVGRQVQPGEGLAGRAIRDRALVMDDALSAEKLPASVRELDLPKLTHGLGMPLIRDGVVVGALTVARTSSGAAFTELEREGLQLLASHAALAVANAHLHTEVSELAVRDALTGLYNRRYFDEALDRLLAAHRRDRSVRSRPLSAIVFDLDQFGAFNKQHGHQVGDAVLRSFADVLRKRFREADLVARLGGEEFIAVLDGVNREGAVAIADDVRARLSARRVRAEDGQELAVTVSAGCAELDPADPTRETLLRTADVALFMAKRAGRDRVVAA